jgi:arabinoxylan arabinofuranohydrolase
MCLASITGCVEEFKYNPDGTIPELPWWSETGIPQVGSLNPYRRIEAETINWSEGVTTRKDTVTKQVYVTNISNNDFIKIRGVDFSKGAKKFEARIAALEAGGSIEIRIDDKTGALLGTLKVKDTGAGQNWETVLCTLKAVKGKHDLYLIFKGGKENTFNFDWWTIKTK